MKRMILITGAVLVLGCSGDDEEPSATCDGGSCVDAGGAGGAGVGGGMNAGGAGGAGGVGGTNATGGMGGGDPDDDGGVEMTDGSVPAPTLPTDGTQGAVCEDSTDCNQNLDCYNAGSQGRGFCSSVCEDNDDCASLSGAAYVCSMSTSVCIVPCEGADDEASCPENMICVNTSGFGAGGPGASYRCKYPPAPPPVGTARAFEPCSTAAPCVDGLVCTGGGFGPGGGAQGYCTAACTPPAGDCGAVEGAAGALTPECTIAFGGGGPGGGMGRCTLDCSEDEDACPGEMACISMGGPGPGGPGGIRRCGYE